jgi:undecaprenyl-diphosphatase
LERQESIRLIANISLAFLPAAVLGLLFGKAIKDHLFHPVPVAIAFVLGGLIILWAERRVALYPQSVRVEALHRMSGLDALKVGIAQCFALIPGTSRSGATIIGAMLFGLSRQVATEFSFFLAIPTLIGAGLYDTWKYRDLLSWADAPAFLLGLTSAFVSALVVVHWLIRFVSNHSFTWFAWYRIAFGAIVLVSSYAGWVVWHA